MKYFTIILGFFLAFKSIAQENIVYVDDHIKYNQMQEFFELYLSGQHNVIANKMTNNGYRLEKYTQDYSLNKKDYSGDYRFVKNVRSDSRLGSSTSNSSENWWMFKTVKYSDIVTEYLIEFSVSSTSSYLTFRSLSQDYYENKEYNVYGHHCFNLDTCIRVGTSIKYHCLTDPEYSPELELNPFYYSSWSRETFFIPKNKSDTIRYPAGKNEEIFSLELYLGDEYEYFGGKRTLSGKFYIRKLHNKIGNWEEFQRTFESKSIEQKISYRRTGKIYIIPIKIGGKFHEYIIDSGASDLVINNLIEKHLRSIGVLRDSDYLEAQSYQLADGSLKTFRRVNIPTIEIGSNVIRSVIASINPDEKAPLLLGKSFLDKFAYWKINNQTGFFEYKIK